MTRAEIEQRIAELQAEIEELEKQKKNVCPFELPVRHSAGNPSYIVDMSTQRLAYVYERAHTDYIARAINAYPAYRALRDYWDKARPCDFFTMPDDVAELWHAAHDAVKAAEQYDA